METHVELTLIAACQQGDAADLTQEAFVDAFNRIQRFRAESSFGTWLYRIAVNRCLKAARRNRPESTSFDDDESPVVAIDRGPTPEEQLVRKETHRRRPALPADCGCPRMHRARKRVRDALSSYLIRSLSQTLRAQPNTN